MTPSTNTVEPLSVPEFKPKVPEFILGLCGESPEGKVRRYLLERMDVQDQQTAWLVRNALAENRELRRIEARVTEIELEARDVRAWRNTLTGKWGLIGAAAAIAFTALVASLCQRLLGSIFGR